MKRKTQRFFLAFFLLIVITLAFSPSALAAGVRVFDDALLFDSTEAASLESMIASLRGEMNMDMAIVTTYDAQGKTAQQYADDFYDDNNFGTGSDFSGVLLLIDMDNREAYITTTGTMIRYLTDERINSLLDDVVYWLGYEDYNGAAESFLTGVSSYYELGIPSNQYNYDTETGDVSKQRSVTLTQILLFLGIAIVVGIICCAIVVARYKLRIAAYRYPFHEKSSLALTVQNDIFVNRTVTSRTISTSSSGSGGRSSTHTSSSGRSHGGGGRKF